VPRTLDSTAQVIALSYLRSTLSRQRQVAQEALNRLSRDQDRWASRYFQSGVIDGLTRALHECDLALDHLERFKEVMKSNGRY